MSIEKNIADWKKGNFKPLYWLEGEESYFIDELMHYAEHKILTPAEAEFNLSVFYGKDTEWSTVINACRRYPMFANKQVVLLKEAQQMRDIEKLEPYIVNPLISTIFIISYKEKKLDARTKFAKTIKANGEILTTKKLYDNQLPEWTNNLIKTAGLTITQKALLLLVEHIGNDLTRIKNEIEKLTINLNNRKNITEDDIENYIGVSKEYNVFELHDAVAKKNISKAIRIIQYFKANPKAAPIQQIIPALYNFFSKVYMITGAGTSDEKAIASLIGLTNTYFLKDYMVALNNYKYGGIEKILLLLHHYNLRSIGVNDAGTNDADLLKELVMKIAVV
ncbi:MAG: DNA polymerase III subunit delta [Bacteroidetes bacterium]|nr:DNA polymerase III subunit delta [Bacteroidota bacterium]MBS1650134.1 DNA polymerase III subunit delta [Bacteroidota bacterium]